ncbi:NAD(P)-dependent oxidoreductase [Halorarius litoreus]|uniref:NAD(P)-dependent oxidoreductase n=1 Tax=Halorarius litoreus TaxID=2962676 RepID=UPI0020CDD456|nr:NAD(P)-dependent oxidoreductase [Halorarius litoreus]
MTRIGFIGLGNFGKPIAEHLLSAGYEMTVYDIRDEAVASLVASGAQGADSPAAVGKEADVVFTVLVNPDQVEAVVSGPDGLLETLDPGATLIDVTTGLPDATDELERMLAEHDVDLLGAPASGNQRAGELTAMVAGRRELFEEHRELFDPFSSRVFHVGDRPSDGNVVKLLNNYLTYNNLYAACEAVVAGHAAGLDREKLLEVINASAGSSTATRYIIPVHVLDGQYDIQGSIGIADKDLRLVDQFLEDNATPGMLASNVRHLFRFVAADMGGPTDLSRTYDFVQEKMAEEK